MTEFYPFGSTITGICTGTARQVSEQGKLEYEFGKPLWIISKLPIKIMKFPVHFSSIINGVTTTSVTL
jgi:hypothetical protein